MTYLSNAFSLGMLPPQANVKIVELETAPDYSGAVSVVGHQDTASILGVPYNRVTIRLAPGDVLIVAQYDGPRMPEGCTKLPDGARFRWFKITV